MPNVMLRPLIVARVRYRPGLEEELSVCFDLFLFAVMIRSSHRVFQGNCRQDLPLNYRKVNVR